MEIQKLLVNIELRDKIWFAKTDEFISFPDDGLSGLVTFEDNSFWFKQRNNILIHLAKTWCPDSVFFDIGGGNGYVSRGLVEAGITTVLVEPGQAGCENAVKRNIPTVVCATLQSAGPVDNVIPNAGAFDVIEHIEDDLAFCKSIYNALAPGGIFMGTVPAYNWLWSAEDIQAGHFRRHTRRSITKVLHSAGFKVKYSSYFFSALILPIFLFRSITSLFGTIRKKPSKNEHAQDHSEKPGILGNLLNKSFNWEFNKIRQGKILHLGTSIVFVAQKN
jgi:SAM-dependent methyltransferase